jgi:hypothetical protein
MTSSEIEAATFRLATAALPSILPCVHCQYIFSNSRGVYSTAGRDIRLRAWGQGFDSHNVQTGTAVRLCVIPRPSNSVTFATKILENQKPATRLYLVSSSRKAEIYLHSRMRLHGVVFSQLQTRPNCIHSVVLNSDWPKERYR